MDRQEVEMCGSQDRFEAYAKALAGSLGHADRAGPMRDYCTGLMLPLERKSIEPLAAATAPSRVSAQHQSLMHFVSSSPWSDEKLLAKVRELVVGGIEAHGPIEAWIVDDTGFRKHGRHSVGVARQYLGEIGKQDNCQVAVSLSLANAWASLPVALRLYLPKDWAEDRARRRAAGVPDEIAFSTKPQMALEQIRWAVEAGLPRGVALMDPGYGHDARMRTGVSALGLAYVAGVLSNDMVFGPGADI
jgi:SRSO17 transposase